MENLLKWVPTSGSNIPDNAVLGGQEADGRPLFIARAIHNGYFCPGKTGYHLPGCHTGSEWKEKWYDKYDVLTLPPEGERNLSWKKDSFGNLPENAVSVCPSSPLYIGRHRHAGGIHVGKIDIRNKAMYVPFGGREHQYYDYEVLVCNQSKACRYNLYNVHYDLLSAQVHTDNDLVEFTSKQVSNSTNRETEISVRVPFSKMLTHQWNFETDIKHGTSVKIIGAIPLFIESKFKMSPLNIMETTYGQPFKDDTRTFIETKMRISPKSNHKISVMAFQQDVNVPYTASLTEFTDDGKEIKTQISGMYHCKTYTDYQTTK